MEITMKPRMMKLFSALTMVAMIVGAAPLLNAREAKTTVPEGTVPVQMTVTASVSGDRSMPEITPEDVFVKRGKERLHLLEWVPAKGDRAGLELFILIDDASDTSLGSHLGELRAFINSQPPTTAVGVGYMRNATIQVVQDPTTDHEAAAKSLRLPFGSVGAYGSPYLSVIDLMKRWPESQNRREVVMITDGIDRARRGRNALMNPDVDSAIGVAQREGIMIHTI